MFQIKNPDALHSIANWIRFFCVCRTIAFRDDHEIIWLKIGLRAWRADSSAGTAFGKICIKIEKCRTKAADLRPPLFDI